MDIFKKISFKTNTYFASLLLAIIVLMISFFAMTIDVKEKALVNAEDKYHCVDEVYGINFLEAKELGKDITYLLDDNCYVGIIDKDGNVLSFTSGKNSTISTSNIFKYLNTAKMTNPSYDEAINVILSGDSGIFEFYSGNQSKVLIYTSIDAGKYSVVRIIPKKYFVDARDEYSKITTRSNEVFIFGVVVLVVICFYFRRYALKVETSAEKHDLIAADNDLISFTYHSSIASFEMTGAVEKIFGPEVAKRGQIDWNTLSRLLHPDDQMLLRNISKAVKNGDTKYTTEFRLVDEEAQFHWYRLNGKCVFDDNNDIRKFVGTIQNSDDQISHENMLKDKAEHDLLTGLLNKITIQEAVDASILSAQYSIYAFYIVDLDNFKAVNDNLGHAVGDKVLTDVASKLQLVFNEADYIGRLGGDEFAVLLVIPSMMTSQADKLIREKAKLLNEILRADYGDGDTVISVSASIGIAMYPADGGDFQTLYQHADRALYHSKENGKNQFTFYTEIV